MMLNGGDIWSTGAFSFESPLKDLLDTENYTVQDLLSQDELLQELRGRHPQLVSFLSSEESVTELVRLLSCREPLAEEVIVKEEEGENDLTVELSEANNNTDTTTTTTTNETETTTTSTEKNWLVENTTEPISPTQPSTTSTSPSKPTTTNNNNTNTTTMTQEEYDQQYLRYPYMACEVFCCEIPSILDILVTGFVPLHMMDSIQKNGNANDTDIDTSDKCTPTTSNTKEEEKEEGEATSTTVTTDNKSQTNSKATSNSNPQPKRKIQRQSILDLLFSLLTSNNTNPTQQAQSQSQNPSPLDDRRAGYLEKILIILFRMKKNEMAAYINGDHLLNNDPANADDTADGSASKDGASASTASGSRSSSTASLNQSHHSHEMLLNQSQHSASGSSSGIPQAGGEEHSQPSDEEEEEVLCHKGGGIQLLHALFQNLQSHSIAQIIQRLLLPRPTTAKADGTIEGGNGNGTGDSELDELEEDDDDDDALITPIGDLGYIKSKWADNEVALELLLRQLLDDVDIETCQHASEILISIIQNSPLTSNIMRIMTSEAVITRLLTNPRGNLTSDVLPCYFSCHESTMTIYMSVLETLVLQLGGYGAVPAMANPNVKSSVSNPQLNTNTANGENTQDSSTMNVGGLSLSIELGSGGMAENPTTTTTTTTTTNAMSPRKMKIHHSLPNEAQSTAITMYLPQLLSNLSRLLTHSNTSTWTSSVQYSNEPQQRLGTSRLRIVRLLESFVLLGHPEVDHILSQSDCLEICLDLFWNFAWCSMLHQSVANLLVHVLEGGMDRLELQEYFLYRCDLPRRLMDSFVGTSYVHSEGKALAAIGEELSGGAVMETVSSDVAMQDEMKQQHDMAGAMSMNGIGSSGSMEDVIPVSDDDIDAIMEQEDHIMAVQQELNHDEPGPMMNGEDKMFETGKPTDRTVSMTTDETTASVDLFDDMEKVSLSNIPLDGNTAKPEEMTLKSKEVTFRVGFMGHVIIICQALVHASGFVVNEGNNPSEQKFVDVELAAPEPSHAGDVPMPGATNRQDDEDMQMISEAPSDEMQEIALPTEAQATPQGGILNLLQKHHLYTNWNSFIATTLASETAIQSTPLGGQGLINEESVAIECNLQHNTMAVETPDDIDDEIDEVLEGTDEDANGGFIHAGEAIDLDDADLDIAASMMEALNLPSSEVSNTDSSGSTGHHRQSGVIAGNGVNATDKGNFGGIIHVNHKTGGGYLYDDPLGGNNHPFTLSDADEAENITDNTASESSEGFDSIEDKDVPVMDLFVGGFNNDAEGWANFDDAFGPSKEDDSDEPTAFKTVDFNSGEDLFANVDPSDVIVEDETTTEDLFSNVNTEDLFAMDSSTSMQLVNSIAEINGTNGDELAQNAVKNTEHIENRGNTNI